VCVPTSGRPRSRSFRAEARPGSSCARRWSRADIATPAIRCDKSQRLLVRDQGGSRARAPVLIGRPHVHACVRHHVNCRRTRTMHRDVPARSDPERYRLHRRCSRGWRLIAGSCRVARWTSVKIAGEHGYNGRDCCGKRKRAGTHLMLALVGDMSANAISSAGGLRRTAGCIRYTAGWWAANDAPRPRLRQQDADGDRVCLTGSARPQARG
jgi:hypothetical protein